MKHQAQTSGLIGEPVAAGLDRAWRFCPNALGHPPRCGDAIRELLRQVQERLQTRSLSGQAPVDTAASRRR